jgi:hypothetical protein
VHAAGQHRHQLGRDVGVKATALRPVKDCHESSDGRCKQDPAGPQDPPRLDERSDPLSSTQEVVERAEEQHRIDRRIRLREPAGVTDFGGQVLVLKCGSDMPWGNVDEMYAVAPAREPGRVYAGAAADVEHHGRRRWQLTLQQLARAKQLEAVMAKPEKALPLVLPGIVGEQVLTLRHHVIVDEPSTASQQLCRRKAPSLLCDKPAPMPAPVSGPAIGTSPVCLEQRRLRGAATSDEGFQQGDVVIVAFALNVAMVESQLLRYRQAVHHSSVD